MLGSFGISISPRPHGTWWPLYPLLSVHLSFICAAQLKWLMIGTWCKHVNLNMPSHIWIRGIIAKAPLRSFDLPTQLNTSLEAWFNAIFLDQPEARLKGTYGYIHVEDLALAHVTCMQKENAGGKRIIVSAGTYILDYHHSALSQVWHLRRIEGTSTAQATRQLLSILLTVYLKLTPSSCR